MKINILICSEESHFVKNAASACPAQVLQAILGKSLDTTNT